MKLYKVAEIATLFRVAERTVYNWVEFGYLKAIKVRDGKGTIRIPEESLQEFLENYQTIETPVLFKRKKAVQN